MLRFASFPLHEQSYHVSIQLLSHLSHVATPQFWSFSLTLACGLSQSSGCFPAIVSADDDAGIRPTKRTKSKNQILFIRKTAKIKNISICSIFSGKFNEILPQKKILFKSQLKNCKGERKLLETGKLQEKSKFKVLSLLIPFQKRLILLIPAKVLLWQVRTVPLIELNNCLY